MPVLRSVLLITFLAAVGPAFAQTSSGAQSQGNQQGDAVQAGAGTKADVTPGSSGPQLGDAGEAIEPLPATFPIRPPTDPFYGPAMLPVELRQMRCEVIVDASAKQRCDAHAQRRNPGTSR